MTILLVGCIIVYDVVHKAIALAPVLMAGCRVLLYWVAASVAKHGVTGRVVWSSLALGAYVLGLSHLARKEGTRAPLKQWPLLFLGAPLVLAYLVDDGDYRTAGVGLGLILAIWVLWALRHALWQRERSIGYAVSFLLAGIALVDFLAVGEFWHPGTCVFGLCFVMTLLMQRRIPGT